jgi:hypothetical protein
LISVFVTARIAGMWMGKLAMLAGHLDGDWPGRRSTTRGQPCRRAIWRSVWGLGTGQ